MTPEAIVFRTCVVLVVAAVVALRFLLDDGSRISRWLDGACPCNGCEEEK